MIKKSVHKAIQRQMIDIYLQIDKACVSFLKLFTNFPYLQTIVSDKTCFFFKLLLILPIRKLLHFIFYLKHEV